MTFFLALLFVVLVFWRPQEWLFPWMFGWPILDAIVVFASLTLFIEVDQGQVRIPRRLPQLYLLAGLWFAAMMSHIAHTYWGGMMWTYLPVFKICFFCALLLCVLDRPSRLRWLAIVFVAMACLMAIHALMQQRWGYGFAWQAPVIHIRPGDEFPRARSLFFGIFEDPNDLAQILATAIPFAFVITKRRTLFSMLLGSVISYFLIQAIIATDSRGGFVALGVVASVTTVLLLPARWLPVSMSLLVLGGLILCPLSAGHMDASAHDRVVFWGQANWIFKENMLFGIGFNMFGEFIDKSRAAHNMFVLCYTELGVFGYWFWFSLLQIGVVGCWRTRAALTNPDTEDQAWLRRFAGLSIAALAGFSASGYFLTRTFVHPLFFLFALLGAVPIVAERLLPEDHPPLIEPRRDIFVMCSIGSLGSIVYIYVSIILLNKAFYG